MADERLGHGHRQTLQAIFQHPVARNLEWRNAETVDIESLTDDQLLSLARDFYAAHNQADDETA